MGGLSDEGDLVDVCITRDLLVIDKHVQPLHLSDVSKDSFNSQLSDAILAACFCTLCDCMGRQACTGKAMYVIPYNSAGMYVLVDVCENKTFSKGLLGRKEGQDTGGSIIAIL